MFEHRSFGHTLKLSVRGASHAPALSFRLEGFPADAAIDEGALAAFMQRRAPGRDDLSTQRREADRVELKRTGTVVTGRIANTDTRPADYGTERTVPRPGHADFGQWIEQGRIPTGGGANSGRLTAALCAAGGLCIQELERRGIRVTAEIVEIAGQTSDFEETIRAARADGDSVGGVVRCTATGLTAGLGGALFAGVESELSSALFAIPGVKGIEFGNGFASTRLRGSQNDDPFVVENGVVRTDGNNHGGILGGRTSGMPLVVTVALKPTPTVFKPLPSVDLATGQATNCEMKGRHDPCIVRRAVPVVEAVTAFTLFDLILTTERATPRICLTLTGRTLEEDLAQLASERYFTDLVELRVDRLDPGERAHVADFPSRAGKPVILTFRRTRDGGSFDGTDDERAAFFRAILASSSARTFYAVDFEADFRRDDLTALANQAGLKIIRSLHDFEGTVPQAMGTDPRAMGTDPRECRGTDPSGVGTVPRIIQVLKDLRGKTCEIPKIAFKPTCLADVARLFDEAGAFTEFPHILCAMGASGLASRVLAVRTHSLLTYASVGGLEGLGHVTPHELVKTYRIRTLDASATLYGVTGWPLKATRSPELNNAAFAAADEDAIMIPFPSETASEALAFMKAMHMKGMAVTIPHKEAIIPLLDAVSEEARTIGAVNTVVCENGKYVGYNTDAAGFSAALTAFLDVDRLDGRRVAVLGAGGASKAVVYALRQLGAQVEIFHRRPLDAGFDIIVNATPVDPIPDSAFTGGESVYDLVYVPEETPLMKRARAAGCRVANGLTMLAAQAREQRRLYRCDFASRS